MYKTRYLVACFLAIWGVIYLPPTHSELEPFSASSVPLTMKSPCTLSPRERMLAAYHGDHSVSKFWADGDPKVLTLLEAIPDFLRCKSAPQEETSEALELLQERLIAFWPPFIKEVNEVFHESFYRYGLEEAIERWKASRNLMHQSVMLVLDEKQPETLSNHLQDLYSGLRRLLILRQDVRFMMEKGRSVQPFEQDDEDRL